MKKERGEEEDRKDHTVGRKKGMGRLGLDGQRCWSRGWSRFSVRRQSTEIFHVIFDISIRNAIGKLKTSESGDKWFLGR